MKKWNILLLAGCTITLVITWLSLGKRDVLDPSQSETAQPEQLLYLEHAPVVPSLLSSEDPDVLKKLAAKSDIAGIAQYLTGINDASLKKRLMSKAFQMVWANNHQELFALAVMLFEADSNLGTLAITEAIIPALKENAWENGIALGQFDTGNGESDDVIPAINGAISGLLMPLVKKDFGTFEALSTGLSNGTIPQKVFDRVAYFIPLLGLDESESMMVINSLHQVNEDRRDKVLEHAVIGLTKETQDDAALIALFTDSDDGAVADLAFSKAALARVGSPERAFLFSGLIGSEEKRFESYKEVIGTIHQGNPQGILETIGFIPDENDRAIVIEKVTESLKAALE